MTADTVLRVRGSAGAGALILSAVNGFFLRVTKRAELEPQDMEMALNIRAAP
jgi:hypothetical protein